METRKLGKTEIEITPILMGTWQAGKRMWTGIDDEVSIRAIRGAVDAGISTIDTAEIYGEGHSERIVAQAIEGIRDRVVIASKVFANHLQYDAVIEACERSLKNLETDYLDLYQIHWPAGAFNSEIVPVSETMAALNQLKADGKIRAIGVSNFSREQLSEALQYGEIVSLQPPYSLFWRKVEADAQPLCIENNITILAYSSMAQGLLTGKFGPNHQFAEGDHRSANVLFNSENYPRALAAIEQLKEIAAQYECSMAQLSLAWLIAQPLTCAIAGARNMRQAQNNAGAGDVKLSAADIAKIDAIGRTVTDHLDDNPVMWNF
ncbi:MAG: aldo/keto reductase [Cyanobacteria bacterium P01_H01_bin.15]